MRVAIHPLGNVPAYGARWLADTLTATDFRPRRRSSRTMESSEYNRHGGQSMKHQYFGDVNDYRKYGLLRMLAMGGAQKIGISWMLTPNDQRSDGNKTRYLDDADSWSVFDPKLFALIHCKLYGKGNAHAARSIVHIDDTVIPKASFWAEPVPDDEEARKQHFAGMWAFFQKEKVELLFFDPDNGLAPNGNAELGNQRPKRSVDSRKHLFRGELQESIERGFSTLFYQHFNRTPRLPFVERAEQEIAQLSPCGRSFSFWTPHVVFFLAPAKAHLGCLEKAIAKIQTSPWATEGTCKSSRCNDYRQILVRECQVRSPRD